MCAAVGEPAGGRGAVSSLREQDRMPPLSADGGGSGAAGMQRPASRPAFSNAAPSPIARPGSRGEGRPSTSLSGSRSERSYASRGRSSSGFDAQQQKEAESRSRRIAKIKPVEGPIAGYRPATEAVDSDTLQEARNMLQNEAAVKRFISTPDGKMACDRAGVDAKELRPLSLDHFRVDPRTNETLKPDKQQRRLDHYNSRRVFKLGLVLTASRNLEHTSAEVQENKEREMRKLFARSLVEEKRRLRKMERDRLKRQTVLERENEQLLLRRKEWDQRKETIAHKHRRIAEMQEEQQRRQRERAEQHAAAIQAAQQAREEKEERSRREAEERQAERERRMQRFLDERTRQMHATREKEREREEQRRRVREQSDQRLNQRRKEIWASMSRKEEHVQRVQEQKMEELEGEKEERFLRSISRKENARRIRKEREYHKRQLAERMKDSYRKMDILADLHRAIEIQRDQDRHVETITRDDWKERTVLQRNVTPGPGEYDTPSTIQGRGGVWGKENPKSDLDWVVYNAKQLPGPGEYASEDGHRPTGVAWGKEKPKSDLDWIIYHAKQMPGPASYCPPRDTTPYFRPPNERPGPKPGGRVPKGRPVAAIFGTESRDSTMDRMIQQSQQLPGPGSYGASTLPKPAPRLHELTRELKAEEELKRVVGKSRLPRRPSLTMHMDDLRSSPLPGRSSGSPLVGDIDEEVEDEYVDSEDEE